MQQQDNCVFCKIARGEAPAMKIGEDALTIAFMDINPASEGHALVISREHFANVLEIDEPTLIAVTVSARRLARAIDRALGPPGLRIMQFNGATAGQTVFHYHVHLVPVREGQHVDLHGRGPGNTEQIAGVAAKLRAALQA